MAAAEHDFIFICMASHAQHLVLPVLKFQIFIVLVHTAATRCKLVSRRVLEYLDFSF